MKILKAGLKNSAFYTYKPKCINIKLDEKKILYSTNGDMIYQLPLPIKEIKDFKINQIYKQIPQHNFPLL